MSLITGLGKVKAKRNLFLKKDGEEHLGNLYTGYSPNFVSKTVGVSAFAAYGGVNTYMHGRLPHDETKNNQNVTYGGTAPILNADGVGSRSNAPTLGAGGNMVLGMHQARRG